MNPPPLKSVDGSVPCQPISFHSSDFSGGMSRLGYANLQSCLKASWCSTREPSKGICNLDLKVFSLSSCKGLRYTGLLFWLSNEKGNNLPNSDPEPTIIFANHCAHCAIKFEKRNDQCSCSFFLSSSHKSCLLGSYTSDPPVSELDFPSKGSLRESTLDMSTCSFFLPSTSP